MASTESLGLMLFTIEIMKPRLTSSGLSSFTLAFTNCRRMPCIASRSATPMRPPSAVRQAPDLDDRWRIRVTRALSAGMRQPWFDRLRLEHDPEKGVPVFRKDHAQKKIERDDDSKKSHPALVPLPC